jgi:predicted TIM-barrel fold metal-dependent hydrolase
MLPPSACDCHVHVFDPRFPLAPGRTYTPGVATGEQLDRMHRQLGTSRTVLVQPSPYGTDNSCLLSELRRRGEQARGVVVIDPAAGPPPRDWHALGVRGVRINLATRSVHDPDVARTMLNSAAAVVADLGWHLQLFVDLASIAAMADGLAALPVPVVFDHYGLAAARLGPTQPGFAELLDLLRTGRSYVKLSAPQRISKTRDPADAEPIAAALIAAAPDQLVWGTDWPHTGGRARTAANRLTVEPFHLEDDASTVRRLLQWAGPDVGVRILVTNPARLYGFG